MSLVAVRVKRGVAFSIYVLREDGECPLEDFIAGLDGPEAGIISRYMQQTVDIGLITNPEKSKKLDNGMAYWRTPRGIRLFYFTDAGKVLICTSAYRKKKDRLDPNEITRAEGLMNKYKAAKANNKLTFDDNE